MLLGIGRYIKGLPLGFGIDILVLTYIALFMNKFKEKIDWTLQKKILRSYALYGLPTPYLKSLIRSQKHTSLDFRAGYCFYPLLFIPLTLMFIDSSKNYKCFLHLGYILTIGNVKGIMQMTMGVDFAEQEWLNEEVTKHIFSLTKVFSFFSAGQFGANQGYTGVVFLIYAMSQSKILSKFFSSLSVFRNLWYGYLWN
jgi:hypothetical protein